jgi:hypothetical protein
MTARAPRVAPPEEDPVLRAFERARTETDPKEILAAVEAERAFLASGGSAPGARTHEELVAAICAHHGITLEEWAASNQ